MMPLTKHLLAAAAAALMAAPTVAGPVTNYVAKIQPLNNSGVTGAAQFSYDSTEHTLGVVVLAHGLTPNTLHPQHLHGRFGEEGCAINAPSDSQIPGDCLDGIHPIESNVPTLAQNDLDGDGFLETVEGQPAYGPVLLNLSDPAAGRAGVPSTFPMSDANGDLFFTATYDLDGTDLLFDPIFMVEHDITDLFPLIARVYVIHGGFVSNGPGLAPGEVGPDTDDEFVVLLPVGAGEVERVPEPGAIGLLGLGLLGLGMARTRRRAQS